MVKKREPTKYTRLSVRTPTPDATAGTAATAKQGEPMAKRTAIHQPSA